MINTITLKNTNKSIPVISLKLPQNFTSLLNENLKLSIDFKENKIFLKHKDSLELIDFFEFSILPESSTIDYYNKDNQLIGNLLRKITIQADLSITRERVRNLKIEHEQERKLRK